MGRELALQYARLGATVVCLDINQQTNENTANEIAKITERSVYTYQYVHVITMSLVSFYTRACNDQRF